MHDIVLSVSTYAFKTTVRFSKAHNRFLTRERILIFYYYNYILVTDFRFS